MHWMHQLLLQLPWWLEIRKPFKKVGSLTFFVLFSLAAIAIFATLYSTWQIARLLSGHKMKTSLQGEKAIRKHLTRWSADNNNIVQL